MSSATALRFSDKYLPSEEIYHLDPQAVHPCLRPALPANELLGFFRELLSPSTSAERLRQIGRFLAERANQLSCLDDPTLLSVEQLQSRGWSSQAASPSCRTGGERTSNHGALSWTHPEFPSFHLWSRRSCFRIWVIRGPVAVSTFGQMHTIARLLRHSLPSTHVQVGRRDY